MPYEAKHRYARISPRKARLLMNLIRGRNGHHAAEAIFKAFAVAVRMAKEVVSSDVPSTKGVL